ncbi:MAG: PLP-dependent aminotransferase family protein [Gemmataceae bacterium]
MSSVPIRFSAQSVRTTDSPISYFIQKAIETPGLISLAAGLVDEGSLPAGPIAEAAAAILADPKTAQAALQYGSTQGLPSLRAKILQHITQADGVTPAEMNLSIDDVTLTTGSQQLLYLLGEVIFDTGDIVITEAPSYFVYHDCLKSHGVRVLSVPMDADGMNLDALEALLVRLEQTGELARVKLIYTVDYFQNPTGLTLAAERRPKLVALAARFSREQRILILEDAAYRELRYDGPDVVSIKRFDPTNEYVIYTSTFSKPCAPGLKTGYTLAPRDLTRALNNMKGNHDFGSTNLSQHILDRLLASGAFQKHVEHLRGVYRAKKDAMLRAIETEFADWPAVQWTQPGGGLYVWLTLPEPIDTTAQGELVERALAAGVLYIPGAFGHVPDAAGHIPTNEIRLSFGVASLANITEGIRRLRAACRGLETAASLQKAPRRQPAGV